MVLKRVLACAQFRAGGLGALRELAARVRSPSSPAAWKPAAESGVSGQVYRRSLLLTSRQAAVPQDLLPANSRLSRRLPSLNTCAAQLVGLVLGWCWDRCRTFLEYEPLAQSAGATRATELLSLSKS